MPQPPFSRAWLEVDLSASRSNFRHIREQAAPCEVLAVLKADGYGLGAEPLARAFIDEGARRIGVATAAEALALRHLGVQLQVMSAVFPEELPDLIRAGVELPVTDLAMARAIGAVARSLGRVAKGHMKLDTGMGRLGTPIEEADEVVPACCAVDGLEVIGIFAHFPMSCEHRADYCRRQLGLERDLIGRLSARGIRFALRHAANSDAISHFPDSAREPFNMVRAGITLHGLVDCGESAPEWLRPVASFRARLAAVRTLPAGRTVGYGGTFTLQRPTRIGTLAAGYADGVPLALSNNGDVLVAGRRCPVVGRVSMDYTTLDLTNAPDAKPGDAVTLFGRDGDDEIPAMDWAVAKRTHPYDIICSVAPRVPRVYLGGVRERQ